MLFCTMTFLGFFAVAWSVYWSLRWHRARMLWLLAASCVFYASWNPWFLLLLLGSTSIDYLVALRLEHSSPRRRQLLLTTSILVNLGLLGWFKYALFTLHSTSSLLSLLGIHWTPPAWRIVLPLGISFYTFEAISYVVDVHRGKIRAIRSPLDYALYILFFPHLVAGPIVRSGDFVPQLSRPKSFSWPRLQLGVQLFLLGWFKKAILADHVGAVIDPVFADPAAFSPGTLWLATLGYAAQIYGDFSGYSDMAVGLAHTLGFRLPANFLSPYLSASAGELWRRWHVSLSNWLRDYLFFPMGGSRLGPTRTCVNLFVLMLICGLWHGASWNYLAWGAWSGALLVLERLLGGSEPSNTRSRRLIRVPLTFLGFCLGLVFVRTTSLTDAAAVLRGLVTANAGQSLGLEAVLLVLVALVAVLAEQSLARIRGLWRLGWRLPAPVAGSALALVVLVLMVLAPMGNKLFIYFQY